ncbi:hypothetical protein QJS04_geneDACA005411 [Acorus gramineus]|uniref:Reverse transcriptase domain-containing protein n=1 Tax=Acorus gramineus TaxID=55184 RepID=A0AAV9A5S2_ACOGR|nr:hypothetical protein QJS04_geneDACA005411 [Acorus gramineus]
MVYEKMTKHHYEEDLICEQEIINQKAKMCWLQEGDRCSKFFYAQFATRKSHNSLRKVLLPDGSKVTDQRQVQHHVVEFYKNLLNKETHIPVPELTSKHRLTEGDNRTLFAEVSGNTKESISHEEGGSLGLDGFTVGFFQACWAVVKDDIVMAVKEFFQQGTLLQQLNTTFIALIPKNTQACSLDQFRPISLCGTVYKLITKILASRLQLVVPSLVSLNQTSFVKGRKLSHGILLAHEMARYLSLTNGKGRAAVKLDLLAACPGSNEF